MSPHPFPLVVKAVDAVKAGDRRAAATLVDRQLKESHLRGDAWWPTSQFAAAIGEIDLAVESARRAAWPRTVERWVRYCGILAGFGRSEEALRSLDQLPPEALNHPGVLHFRGMIAAERGDFGQAQELYRTVLRNHPDAFDVWLLLSGTKTFETGDPDVQAMESMLGQAERSGPEDHAHLLYALGKALDDIGECDRAFGYFSQAAAARRKLEHYDADHGTAFVEKIIRDFSAKAMARLSPSPATGSRALLVSGLPRSGTTLVQQILVAHSAVSDGAEVNFARPALLGTLDFTYSGAQQFEQRFGGSNAWLQVADEYRHFIDMRFGGSKLVVDKSLNQSGLTGLLLHAIPDARMIWVRRDPQDVAWSCFRTHLKGLSWSWSLTDIARHIRNEERLIEHWRSLFPDRIRILDYEALVRRPSEELPGLLAHFELGEEPQLLQFHRNKSSVSTASQMQVRSPLSAQGLRRSALYEEFLGPFRAAYDAG
jgi:tetratricopeptide (TPR) repeat protein